MAAQSLEGPMNRADSKIRKDIDKVQSQLRIAQEKLNASGYADSIQASQCSIELSVKSVLSLLEIEYEPRHAWSKKQLSSIAQQIQERQILHSLKDQGVEIVRLPRLLFLMNFWASAYLPSKYGMEEAYLASAQDLFERQEVELALQHAKECYQSALKLNRLSKCKLLNVTTQGRLREEDYPHLGYLIAWNDKQVPRERPPDAEEAEGEVFVETISGDHTENAIAFWTEENCFGSIQIHKDHRGSSPKTWPIRTFEGQWWAKKLTVKAFRIVKEDEQV